MSYTKTTWVNGGVPAIDQTNLNKIEQGIEDAHLEAVVVDPSFAGSASDASTELQTKATAAAGGVLKIPAGAYKCEGTVTVPANTTIVAHGAKIYDTTTHRTLIDCSAGGVEIHGLELEGAGNSVADSNGILVKCEGTDNTPSAPTYVTGPRLYDCYLHDSGFYGVLCQYSDGGGVFNSRLFDIGYAGIMGLSIKNFHVRGSHIKDISPGTTQAYGISFTRLVDATSEDNLVPDPRSEHCSAVGNRVENVSLYEGLDTHAGLGIVFANNVISGCKRSIAVTASHLSGNDDFGPQNCTVSGNFITQGKLGNAIMVIGASDGVGSTVEYAEGITVMGNTIEGGGIAADSINGSIQARATRGFVCVGNTITRPAVYGIHLYYDNADFQVSNNSILDPHDNTVTVPSGIASVSNNNTGHIGENSLMRVDTGLATYVGVRGVYVSSATGSEYGFSHNRITCTTAYSLASGLVITTYPTVLSGYEDVAVTTGVDTANGAVTFSKAFTTVPVVTMSTNKTFIGAIPPVGSAVNITTSGFNATVSSADGANFGAATTVRLHWTAVGY